MPTLFKIENSSAISQIEIIEDENLVGIAYTSNLDKKYEFYCENLDSVRTKIEEAICKNESIGKLIHSLRKTGELESIETQKIDIEESKE